MTELHRMALIAEDLDLETPQGDDITIADQIPQNAYADPESAIIDADNAAHFQARLNAALDLLTPAVRRIAKIALQYPGLSHSEIAVKAGVTRQRVHQCMKQFREALG